MLHFYAFKYIFYTQIVSSWISFREIFGVVHKWRLFSFSVTFCMRVPHSDRLHKLLIIYERPHVHAFFLKRQRIWRRKSQHIVLKLWVTWKAKKNTPLFILLVVISFSFCKYFPLFFLLFFEKGKIEILIFSLLFFSPSFNASR